VALVGNGSEIRLDLAKYWDGAVYESALVEDSLSAVIYYLEIHTPLSMAPFPKHHPGQPDFMYGFIPSGVDSREFITMSYLSASHVDAELVAAFLQRHREYLDDALLADAKTLAQQIRDVCKAHAPRSLF